MNQELTTNPFNPLAPPQTFDEIKISLASPERILSWSYGEIKKPETINYRTFKPERDGLFCARIFGPIKDYECLCGKYKRMKYRGVVCEKCGVEVTLQKVRRERMGHIELAAPVAHIWFLKSLPSRIGLMLDMTLRDLERILYFENYVVIEPGLTDLNYGQLMGEEEYMDAQDAYGMDAFTANIGAEAIREMLAAIDLEAEAEQLRADLAVATGELKPKKIIKRLKIIESFIESGNRPEWMILTVVPVIPPELRPLVPLDGGRFATSDLNDLYRRVINRNNRLKRLIELRAPDIIVRNEKRMLQESVDALFDNGRRGRVITGANKRPLKSLSDMLKGKQGRFRQNLLGKRVDFSGRSVIVTGPELKLHQCGLPKKMALELFKPFIYSRLEAKGLSSTVKQAKKLVEKERPEVWDILDEVIREHPVLLNRAPTLHRLGIQAFEPTLIEGKAIQLHPLVCSAFNADFDGDQMAVHVPLSLEAQLEARVLMMSTNNVLSPANGAPIIVPSQDMILGLYYISMEREGMKGEGMVFADVDEVQHALDSGEVHLHTKITARIKQIGEDGLEVYKRFETTPGRMKLGELLPLNAKAPFDLVNRLLRKKEVQQVIDTVYRYCGQKESVIFCDQIMSMGFKEAFKAGISFGKDDMVIPDAKWTIVDSVRDQVKEFEQQYMDGLITQGEKYNKVVDAWSKCSDDVAGAMMDEISAMRKDDAGAEMEPNSIYMMSHSGARGSPAQMKQLGGMRGLMAKPSGDIIESPITSNFREGLTVVEYFISSHGARKGLADTALKTADAGYLTRRLVDVAQDVSIEEEDCGTLNGVWMEPLMDGSDIIAPLDERIVGRFPLDDVRIPGRDEPLAYADQEITQEIAEEIIAVGLPGIMIRSVLTCQSKRGVCSFCYGRNLATGKVVEMGEAVGIIAAQSIGEPGTQLTMRTFHIGGAASRQVESTEIKMSDNGSVEFNNVRTAVNREGKTVVVNRGGEIRIVGNDKKEIHRFAIPTGCALHAEDGQKLRKGQVLYQWDPYNISIMAEQSGRVKLDGMVEGVTVRVDVNPDTGLEERVITEHKQDLHPQITILSPEGEVLSFATIPAETHVVVSDGDDLLAGDLLAKTPRQFSKTKDITGGLPRVAELFEARQPKSPAVISHIDGMVELGGASKGMRKVKVLPPVGKEREYTIPPGKHLNVQTGDRVYAGQRLTDGPIIPQDILAVQGEDALRRYLLDEVQQVYRLQGVRTNDKHIEVIIRQMLRKVRIKDDPGDTSFLAHQEVDKIRFAEVNEQTQRRDGRPAEAEPVLQGITKAALSTESFIAAASFQQTTRVLTEAALSGKRDELSGLKENVIIGHLIPAGTGSPHYQDTHPMRKDKALGDFSDELEIESFDEAASEEPV